MIEFKRRNCCSRTDRIVEMIEGNCEALTIRSECKEINTRLNALIISLFVSAPKLIKIRMKRTQIFAGSRERRTKRKSNKWRLNLEAIFTLMLFDLGIIHFQRFAFFYPAFFQGFSRNGLNTPERNVSMST